MVRNRETLIIIRAKRSASRDTSDSIKSYFTSIKSVDCRDFGQLPTRKTQVKLKFLTETGDEIDLNSTVLKKFLK